MWKWLRAVILLQFEGSGSKLTGMRTAGESLPSTELVMEARVWLGNLSEEKNEKKASSRFA